MLRPRRLVPSGLDADQCILRARRQFELMLDQSCLLAAQTVPRYTSYPTAPHFTPAMDADVYGTWLDTLASDAKLSLYLHVPFCSEICHYCGCHTKAVRRREPVDAYAETLMEEIALIADRLAARKVVHIHWGGGTPSMLGPQRLRDIADRIRELFDVDATCEHAIELDPRHVDRSLICALSDMGVTRASLGVQDLSAHVQKAIGRVQPVGLVAEAVRLLREGGIGAINLDLMYGLPRQTDRDIRRTILLSHSLQPSRIALFGYAHVPWFKTHQRLIKDDELPDAMARLQHARSAQDALCSLGYVAIGLDHFARPDDPMALAAACGGLRRNFQGYTTDPADALIGFGTSSIGQLPLGFVQNAPDIAGYARAIRSGRLATARGFQLSAEDRVRGRIIERLMCDFQVDVDAVAAQYSGAQLLNVDAAFASLAPLAAEGFVAIDGHHVVITERGRPFVRLAAAAFDAYLPRGGARHSSAV